MDGSDWPGDRFIESRGLKVPKHPDLPQGRVRRALRNGAYERKECDAVLRVVREGDRVQSGQVLFLPGIGNVSRSSPAALKRTTFPWPYCAIHRSPAASTTAPSGR